MYVYIIGCADGSLYTGIAKDVAARLREHYHRLPACAKYTRSHPMTDIRCIWETPDKVTACQLEYRIKRLTRKQKEALTANPSQAALLPIDGTATPFPQGQLQALIEEIRGCVPAANR